MSEETRIITKEEFQEYLRIKEDGYGDFSHKKEQLGSARTEDVVLSAVEKCEALQKQLDDANVIIYIVSKFMLANVSTLPELIKGYKEKWGLE